MYKLPFKVIASPTLGQTFSSMHQLPYHVDAADAQVQLAINSANRNLYLKTPAFSVPELEGPLDFSLYFNSRHSSQPQWQLSCLSAIINNSHDRSKISIQAQDGAIIEYYYQAESKRFFAVAPSDYAGCYLELAEKENQVILICQH